MSTLYASFPTSADAEKAAGALLDHGAQTQDLSILSNERTATGQPVPVTDDAIDAEHSSKTGISTTTSADVAAGTVKGATFGIGVGALAALASMFIPGVGLVWGAGALATAMMGATGTALAGAAAGGVTGLLKDQGVPDEVVTNYSSAFNEGGAILALAIPSGDLDSTLAEALLTKYGAQNIATVNAPRVAAEGVAIQPDQPLVVEAENPAIAPIAFAPAQPAVVATPVTPVAPVAPVVPGVPVVPAVPAVPAEPSVEFIDPNTGVVDRRPVAQDIGPNVAPLPEDIQVTTLPPNPEVVQDAGTGTLHQTVGHPTVVNEEPAIVTDPVTGQQRSATIVEEQRAVIRQPAATDSEGHVVMPLDGPEETTVVRDKHVEINE